MPLAQSDSQAQNLGPIAHRRPPYRRLITDSATHNGLVGEAGPPELRPLGMTQAREYSCMVNRANQLSWTLTTDCEWKLPKRAGMRSIRGRGRAVIETDRLRLDYTDDDTRVASLWQRLRQRQYRSSRRIYVDMADRRPACEIA